ncbi:hypothetical protein BDZ45DRAFT_791245 [Acephala macrosclerotiorum]|nr:hypothetical protein BDZ45DRAFT_791245 [Acephala macrosclerotiorum]
MSLTSIYRRTRQALLQKSPQFKRILHRGISWSNDLSVLSMAAMSKIQPQPEHSPEKLEYSPLDPSTSQIRLIHLNPGAGDDKIFCSIHIASLADDKAC